MFFIVMASLIDQLISDTTRINLILIASASHLA